MAPPVLKPVKCVFCGSKKDITREHVMPAWLRKEFPPKYNEYSAHSIAIDRIDDTLVVKPQLGGEKISLGSRTLFMVCAACNNVWMSRIQIKAAPILKRMIRGDWAGFTATEGSIISAWVAMTASVIAMSTRKAEGVPLADRRIIYETKAAPPDWRIFVGKCGGLDEMFYENNPALSVMRAMLPVKPNMPANTCITTIAIGQVILQSINRPVWAAPYDPVLYAYDTGLFPIQPWDGEHLAMDELPIARFGSPEWHRIRFAFRDTLLRGEHGWQS